MSTPKIIEVNEVRGVVSIPQWETQGVTGIWTYVRYDIAAKHERQRSELLEAMRRVAASLNGSGLIADGHPAWPIVRDAIDECEKEKP